MIVLTGGNGRLGRALAKALHDAGLTSEVTVATRDPAAVEDLAALGFRVVAADFGDPRSLDEAFLGAGTLVMISATGPAPIRIPLHRSAIDAAVRARVGRIVYTSRVAPYASSPYPFSAIHDDSEARIRESGISYTFLRNNEFTENLDPWLADAVETGKLLFGAKGPIAFISRAAVVASAVAVITGDAHDGATYELSGPEALDRHGLATVLAEATGSGIVASNGTADDFAATLAAQGRPPFVVEMGKGLYAAAEAGEWSATSSDPERLTGTPPMPVSDHIRAKFHR